MSHKFYILCGEASGDFLAGQLVHALKKIAPESEFKGVGGEHFQNAGGELFFPYQHIAVMGLLEILPHIFEIKKKIQDTINDIISYRPSVLITIDAPGFCNRVIDEVKKHLDIPVIHYVAPSVWAWRPKRAQKLAKRVDHLLCLFPFESPYFTKHNLPTTYVGHPLVELDWTLKNNEEKQKNSICILPGSRKGEIIRHLPIFLKTLEKMDKKTIYLPTIPHLMPLITSYLKETSLNIEVITNLEDKRHAMMLSQCALAASGTVSLELALAKTPMIIAYRVSGLTYAILKKMVNISSVCLVNLLLKKNVVPEYLQHDFEPNRLKKAIQELENDGYAMQQQAFNDIYKLLKPLSNWPSETAAEVVMKYV